MNRILVCALCLLTAASAVPAEGKTKPSIADECTLAFQKLEPRQPAAETLSGLDGSALAWGESYRMVAYVSMYEATKDSTYLKSAMARFDAVLKARDDRKGLRDEIRGKIMPAWGCSTYTKGKHYVWIVHAGMISYPIARAAYLIRRDPALRRQYGAQGTRYLRAVEQTVHAFDGAWRKGPGKGEGYYYSAYLKRGMPFNQQNALGRTLVALYLATGKPEYKAKAEGLARFFKDRLRQEDGRYVWSYWPDRGRAEDISHAAINVDFAFECFRAGLVFTREDMVRFAHTLEFCSRGSEGFSRTVGGRGNLAYSAQMGRWGHLGFVDPKVRALLYDYASRNWAHAGLITAAYLVETGQPLKLDPALHP